MNPANFKVDTSLTALLGENYRSTEAALKELVDNSWDADAQSISIQLPEPMQQTVVTIEDDGAGMTEEEIRNEYLFIARSRTSRKGDTTPVRGRKVKGRKGIGKFAGLLIASEMQLISKSQGRETTLVINKEEILRWKDDLESLDLQIVSKKCSKKESGTTIILKSLNQNLNFPNPVRLSQLLIAEYGRENDFDIKINGDELDIKDLVGISEAGSEETELSGKIDYKFVISDQSSVKEAGIGIRVNGKIIGKPSFLGLEEDEEVPRRLLRRVYAEVEVDQLKDDVTADWGAIFENSKKLEEVKTIICPKIKKAILDLYRIQVHTAKARIKSKLKRKLNSVPLHKQAFANETFEKVLQKFYNEPEDKIETILSVVLDTLIQDEYQAVLKKIEKSADKKAPALGATLSDFGQLELLAQTEQAKNRSNFIDFFEQLVLAEKTPAKDVHAAFVNNLWMLEERFSSMTSSESLDKICTGFLVGKSKTKTTELILCQDYRDDILLIELKSSNAMVGKVEKAKAEKYKTQLRLMFPKAKISMLFLGQRVDEKWAKNSSGKTILLESYEKLVTNARMRVDWRMA